MARRVSWLLPFAAAILASGCLGDIQGRVTLDGAGVEGVRVVLTGNGFQQVLTDEDGAFLFGNVKGGTYRVAMDPPAGYARSVGREVVKKYFSDVKGVDFSIETVTERLTEGGTVVGSSTSEGAHAWLGIPYAAPPVGGLRWKAPRPAAGWTNTWLALETGSACTQIADLLSDAPEGMFGSPVGSEDCLFLNIWAPPFPAGAVPTGEGRLPVMVWIHGGGNSIGDGGGYDGQYLARMYNVIVLTFNYRLGPFGWFTHPALESGDALDDSGNYGTLDAVRVLDWVQENIEAFGGDPGNVTVFGESAGSRDTLAMMITPQAAGKFHRAIAESGGIATTEVAVGWNYIEDGGHPRSSREVINSLLIEDGSAADREEAMLVQDAMTPGEIAAYLEGKSAGEIMRMYEGGYGGMISWPHMFRDGTVLPDADPMALFQDTATYNAVPLIIGSNRDESKLFMVLDPAFVNFLAGVPVGAKDPAYYALYSRYTTDAMKAVSVDAIASTLSRTPGQPGVWAYRFDWDEEPVFMGLVDVGFLLGAAHSLEIAFVFHDFNQFMVPDFASMVYTPENLPGRLELGASMSSYWAEFAYNGDPGRGRGGADLPWTSWDESAPGADKFIVFDTSAGAGIRMSSETITLEGLYQDLLAETGFKTQEQHCGMYVQLFGGTGLWSDEDYRNLGEEGCAAYPPD
jgi:para-nitrobenzyl esterase